jgi:uncharacterized protein (DUF934 family)
MPRRLLRDGRVAVDDWSYAGEAGADTALIVTFDQWQAERDSLLNRGVRLGVVLLPEHDVELLTPDLPRLSLIAAHFPSVAEGRGYSQGRILRERRQFGGELRATGQVHRDQVFFLARCGFNSFELPDAELEAAQAALSTFSEAYQPSNDAGLPLKLRHRR